MIGVTAALNETYQDAEWIVEELRKLHLHAKNWAVDLNPAVDDSYNIHIPVNGMVGNQIFRAILLCGGRLLATPMLGLSRPYEDTSRTEKNMDFHIKWIAALINRKKAELTIEPFENA
jgi:predicted methyltransferase MtxX (methanogen marker protein 4)